MSDLRESVVELVRAKALKRFDPPVRLASGRLSHDYVDARQALAAGPDLETVSRALLEMLAEEDVEFDAVGGLTMGSDPVAIGLAVVSGAQWFSVRKEVKDHGRQRRIEGATLGPASRVLLVEDTVTSGSSALKALDAIEDTGATVVFASAVIDRGDVAAQKFGERGIRYRALVTYRDLGIEAVGP